jgi:hypothetical protein
MNLLWRLDGPPTLSHLKGMLCWRCAPSLQAKEIVGRWPYIVESDDPTTKVGNKKHECGSEGVKRVCW